ncbi:MAG: (Fe-S)-binding protein, partial [Candidatus Helarchaeota archaeon]
MTLEKYRDDIYTCNRSRCGFCRELCPVYSQLKYEAYSSRGKMQIARGLLEGIIEPDDALMECLSLCTLCGYCKARCALQNVEIFKELRESLVKKGFENKYHKKAIKSIQENKSPFGPQKEGQKSSWAQGLEFDQNSNVLFFVGCSYPRSFPQVLKNIHEFLAKVDIKLAYLGDEEDCCGLMMDLTGYRDEFELYKKNYKERLLQLGIDTIMTPCPGCYKILKSSYFNPEDDSTKIKVVHFIEFVANLIAKKKISFKKKIDMTITWHDPCDLGRHMGIFEEPRTILKSIPGIKLVEMKNNRYQARCCGSGGGMLTSNADISIDVAIQRLEEAEETGAEALVTMCPTCESIFEKAIRYTDSAMKLYDLSELLLNTCNGDTRKNTGS